MYEIGKSDLNALEQFLGNKKFLMGDQVCNEDASIFGMVATVIDHDRGPFNQHVLGIYIVAKLFLLNDSIYI